MIAILQTLPMVQAIMLLGIYALLPMAVVLSRYSIAMMVVGGSKNRFGDKLQLNADLFYFDDAIQDCYFSGDASLGWNSANERYSVTGYIKNFSDEAVKRALFVGYLLVSAPRTYGLSFSIKF